METINHECYVSLEIAKLLKEAGFDWKCQSYYQGGIFHQYSTNREQVAIMDFNSAPDYMELYSAPTFDVVQRWFIEVKKMCIVVFPVENRFAFIVVKLGENFDLDDHILEYYTYEEAQEEGNKWMLELISDKGE